MDPLEEAQAIQAEMTALDRVVVKVPSGEPWLVEWHDDASSRSRDLHDFTAEDAALLHDAIVTAVVALLGIAEIVRRC